MAHRTRRTTAKSEDRSPPEGGGNVYFIGKPQRVAKGEGDPRFHIFKTQDVQGSAPLEHEDDLRALDQLERTTAIVKPPFDFADLEAVYQQNSILPPLVAAMVTNIDCTGYDIVPRDPAALDEELNELLDEEEPEVEGEEEPRGAVEEGDEENDDLPFPAPDEADTDRIGRMQKETERGKERKKLIDAEVNRLKGFFDQIMPGESFQNLRAQLRRDLEVLGNAYMEVIRTMDGKLIGLRYVDAKLTRLVRLDRPIVAEKTMERNGKEETFRMWVRERRFVQVIGGKKRFFREFGASRQLNIKTGRWEDPTIDQQGLTEDPLARAVDQGLVPPAGEDSTVPPTERATELIHLTVDKDVASPYGIPRWISNLASAIGSRRAEEFNLEFFDTGGVPPMMILVQGGAIAQTTKDMLNDEFMGIGPKHQAVILEAYGTGDMDASQNVKVTVERFGAERQTDSMFEGYRAACESAVQRAFRIADIFLGKGDSSNFATAMVSMMTTDGQVFAPERKSFDEIVNLLVMPELELGDRYRYVSNPLSIHNAEQQLAAIDSAGDSIEPESKIEQLNQIAGLEMQPKSAEEIERAAAQERNPFFSQGGEPNPFGGPNNEGGPNPNGSNANNDRPGNSGAGGNVQLSERARRHHQLHEMEDLALELLSEVA